MALTYDQISAITERKFLPKLTDNIFNSHPLLKKLQSKKKPQSGGQAVMVPLNYAKNSSGGWYQGADTLQTTDNDVISSAEFDWKQLYENISISRIDELKNAGDAAKLNFVKSKMEIAEKTLKDRLSTGIWSAGTDSKSIVGLRVLFDNTATYGGISQSTYSWWQSQVDSSTTVLTIAALQSLYGDCGEGSEYPNYITSDQDVYDLYYALLTPEQRFTDSDMAKGGFKSLQFNGAPWVVDSYAPANYVAMLNLDYLDLYPHKDEDMRMEPFVKPINQNVKSGKIYWTGVLASSNNRRHGAMSAIAS